MNLYYVEFAHSDSGEVLSDEFQVAESLEHCIAIMNAPKWRSECTHIHSIEHIYEFKDYKDCLRRLEICINYAFAQIEHLSIVAGHFADSTIKCAPERAEMDQASAGTLSFTADRVDDQLKEAKKYIGALEYMTTKQRHSNAEIRTQQNVAQ